MTFTFRGQRYDAAAPACSYFTIAKYRGALTIVHHTPPIAPPAPAAPLKYRGCLP